MKLKDTGLTQQEIKDKVNKYMIETYPKQYESLIDSLPPIPEPRKPEPPKPSKPTQKSPSTPSYIKQYNPDHNEIETAYTIEYRKDKVENTTNSTEKFFANVIEDAVTTSYEAVVTGVINLTRGAHFKSYIDDLLKIKGEAFNAMGIGIDFIGELKDGNGVLGAAILAAGHFATYKVVETMLLSFMINPSIIAIAGVTLLSIFVTSAITTYIDRKIC